MAYSAFGINYDTAAKISAYGGDAETPAQPIWAEDTHQLWIVHGTGGKYRVAMASELASYLTTANAASTYLAKTDAAKTYLGINAKATSAAKADSATTANSASAVPWTGVSGKPQLIPGTGDAGTIKTYETVVAATTVSDSSARSMSLASGGTLTVNNGSANKAWITVVALAGTATITLGSSWSWSGSAPTLAKGLVTLAWYGTFGVATFTKFGS
ncbi:MAG: hypothetical protein BHW61_00315 [Sutterella sp. 63_29]|jgi:hypothetical protein|nr:MAG: hypothetical protein BHW61_00315 [Sutterella sp. 63_29]